MNLVFSSNVTKSIERNSSIEVVIELVIIHNSVVVKSVVVLFSLALPFILRFEVGRPWRSLKVNSLEQLCINLTNEELQQYFVTYVFKVPRCSSPCLDLRLYAPQPPPE